MPVTEKNETRFFIPIQKVDEDKRMVYGYASTEALDSDGEIITREAMEDAIEQYMEFGAVREMHQHWAAGRAKEASFDEKGLYIGAKIVDDQAWAKVKNKVYNGFSVGGEAESRIGNKITRMNLKEISLVDRPANPECLIEVFKMEGGRRPMQLELKPVIKITEADPAKPVEKADKVEKGMNTLARLAGLYETLEYMRNEVHYEEGIEQDADSELPEMIDEACEKIGALILAMAEEEVSEYTTKGEAMDKVEKAKKEDIAERRKAMKEDLESKMKAHKADMDKMESAMGNLDKEDCDKEDLDDVEGKMSKLFGKDDGEEKKKAEGAQDKKAEAEEDGKKEDAKKEDRKKVSKVLDTILEKAIAKRDKGLAAQAGEANETTVAILKAMKSLSDGQDALVEKLSKVAMPALALRAVERDGTKIDVAKMAKENPAAIEDLIAKGEMTRAEAFKLALDGAPRQFVG